MIMIGEQSKQACRNQSMTGLKKGIIVKPDFCQECGSNSRLYMHHNDYSKPYEVVWMCAKCHSHHHNENITVAAPVFLGRELRAKAQREYSMPDVVRQKLEESKTTLKEWCTRRRLKVHTVYKLFSGDTLGLYGESFRAKHYLDINFIGWDKGIKQYENDTHKHLQYQKHEHFSKVLKTVKMKL